MNTPYLPGIDPEMLIYLLKPRNRLQGRASSAAPPAAPKYHPSLPFDDISRFLADSEAGVTRRVFELPDLPENEDVIRSAYDTQDRQLQNIVRRASDGQASYKRIPEKGDPLRALFGLNPMTAGEYQHGGAKGRKSLTVWGPLPVLTESEEDTFLHEVGHAADFSRGKGKTYDPDRAAQKIAANPGRWKTPRTKKGGKRPDWFIKEFASLPKEHRIPGVLALYLHHRRSEAAADVVATGALEGTGRDPSGFLSRGSGPRKRMGSINLANAVDEMQDGTFLPRLRRWLEDNGIDPMKSTMKDVREFTRETRHPGAEYVRAAAYDHAGEMMERFAERLNKIGRVMPHPAVKGISKVLGIFS